MRTTLTLDDDVAAKLRSESRKTGRSFRDVVNDAIRRGLAASKGPKKREPFAVVARDMGELRAGLTLDSVSDLLEQLEGPVNR